MNISQRSAVGNYNKRIDGAKTSSFDHKLRFPCSVKLALMLLRVGARDETTNMAMNISKQSIGKNNKQMDGSIKRQIKCKPVGLAFLNLKLMY
ncbi:hypothetical protein DY000_02015034 [Brassica cretica]|uniref:Uncharacterized protein n=1 Tax=Brassica cretica TaxID=69181 RepID=A0ABQ7CSA2_BRACR|nr:hypothetical protein DY000_02015034 [Brassica cretica]